MKVHVVMLLFLVLCYAVPAFSQDAILPQGDPRSGVTKDNSTREEIRDSGMKQQGQGEKYRVDGELQGGSSQPTASDPPELAGQDYTGLEDPSVNPGQAADLKDVHGRIVKSVDKTHTIRQQSGGDSTIVVDNQTQGDKDLRPGDLITGKVTPQGRAVVVQKEPQANP